MSTTIFVRNLSIVGVHGATALRNGPPRIFNLDIEVSIDSIAQAVQTDNIEHVFDYRHVVAISRHIVEGPSVHLIETLASRICTEVLKHPKVRKINLTLTKREVGDEFDSGITLKSEV